jgi:hypothetical protein
MATLQVAAPLLFQLNRLEQGLEIAFAKTAAAVTLDDFDEDGWAVLDGAGEDLQQVALIVPVHQNAQLLDGGQRL